MNYFNKKILFCLFVTMLKISSSFCMKSVLNETTLSELNERFQLEQTLDQLKPSEYSKAVSDFMRLYFGKKIKQTPENSEQLHKELMDAIWKGHIDQVALNILYGADINQKDGCGRTPLIVATERAAYSIEKNKSGAAKKLSIMELLIQAGALINDKGYLNRTPLEDALAADIPKEQVIKLLLGYGAEITEKALESAKKRSNATELMKILNIHQKLLKQVKSNPTKELLKVTILYNKPYFVQLIANLKPELVTLDDIKLATIISPASVPVLRRALEIAKFRESALVQERLPLELSEHIEKFVKHN